MSNEKLTALEERITSALANASIASAELRERIPETEDALKAAEATAQAERKKALNPVASSDSAKAEQSVWAAEFRRDRLRSFVTHLRQRLAEVEASERQRDWQEDYEAVKARRDALADEFAELYPSLTAQLCELFRRAEALDQECDRINSEAPKGENRRLLGVELTARKLKSFSRSEPPVVDGVKLPDWSQSDRMIWPPRKVPLSVIVATSMMPPPDPRFSADWAMAREKDMARRKQTEKRRAEQQAERDAEKRRAYEANLRR
jgi:hypothetical protein